MVGTCGYSRKGQIEAKELQGKGKSKQTNRRHNNYLPQENLHNSSVLLQRYCLDSSHAFASSSFCFQQVTLKYVTISSGKAERWELPCSLFYSGFNRGLRCKAQSRVSSHLHLTWAIQPEQSGCSFPLYMEMALPNTLHLPACRNNTFLSSFSSIDRCGVTAASGCAFTGTGSKAALGKELNCLLHVS